MSFESQYPTEYDKYFEKIEIERVPVKGDKMSFRIDNDKDFEEFIVTNVEFLFDCGIEQYVEVTVWRHIDHVKERILIFESQVNMDYL